MRGESAHEVKLSRRNLWMVYGAERARLFTGANGAVDDPPGRVERIRQSGHIAAACVSFGAVVGPVARVIYAIPPMVRNTMPGRALVPAEIVESGRMSGCAERQLMWWVRVPAATHNIMLGVNQTIMAASGGVGVIVVVGRRARPIGGGGDM